MNHQTPIKIIHTEKGMPAQTADTLQEGRRNMVQSMQGMQNSQVTIYVQAYNRLDKTKICIESILMYTQDVDYTLLLVDNGSSDGTLEYFQSIPYPKKQILRITKNIGAAFPSLLLSAAECSSYMVFLGNDIIVTKNWLSNILRGMEADETIGMVCPVSSNVSNLQQVNLSFENYEELQQQAAAYNQPDLSKWQERLRLITPATVYRKECLLAVGLPIADIGFFHDFLDDDITFRVRHAGYKAMLAGDTWVHHNHNVFSGEGKDPEQFQRSLEIGRMNFMEKHHGIDAWEDVNNFWMDATSELPAPVHQGPMQVLGVDVRCGTPILDIKNYLRTQGIFQTELSAFTEDAKYMPDLQTICDGIVCSDREEFFGGQYLGSSFDYIVIDKPLNRFHEPQFMLDQAMRLLKPKGILLLSLSNTFGVREFMYCRGSYDLYNPQFAYHIPLEALYKACAAYGSILFTKSRPLSLDEESKTYLRSLLPADDLMPRLLTDTYILGVQKQ